MKKYIPIFLKDFIKSKITKHVSNENYKIISYSQEGEDLIINRFFESKGMGFYIDVGAHHPIRFSNTYLLYQKGWRGINIDAFPGSMKIFNDIRPFDLNIEQAIGSIEKDITFYIFDEPALNTFSENLKNEVLKSQQYHLINEKKLPVKTLKTVLNDLNAPEEIDFLSIDVEGMDFEVLKGNDWNKYKPKLIAIEILNFKIQDADKIDSSFFLIQQGYSIFAKTYNTIFFIRNEF